MNNEFLDFWTHFIFAPLKIELLVKMPFTRLQSVQNILVIISIAVSCINCYPVNFSWEQNEAQANATVNPSQMVIWCIKIVEIIFKSKTN